MQYKFLPVGLDFQDGIPEMELKAEGIPIAGQLRVQYRMPVFQAEAKAIEEGRVPATGKMIQSGFTAGLLVR